MLSPPERMPATRRRIYDDDSQSSGVEPGASAATHRALQRVGIVGHEQDDRIAVHGPTVIHEVHLGDGPALPKYRARRL